MRRSALLTASFLISAALGALAAACGPSELPIVDVPSPDAGQVMNQTMPDGGQPTNNTPDSGMMEMVHEPLVVPAGEVSGDWSGEVRVEGEITVAAGDMLDIAEGAHVVFSGNYGLTVQGTLLFSGTGGAMTRFEGSGAWKGIRVGGMGTMQGAGLEIGGARVCLAGESGSTIELSASIFNACQQALSLANGGRFSRVTIIGGNTNAFTGGTLEMSDSTIDFRLGAQGPDCTDWAGGTAIIDHVHFTGCHCPLHFNSTSAPITVTNSIFDNGANAVMIARTTAVFTGNNLETSQAEMLDIGGGISADIGGNYWGGGPPVVGSRNLGQFTGADNYATEPFGGAGPR